MINYVAVTNSKGSRLELVLDQPHESGFLVKDIDGLGPVEGSISITDIVSSDGGFFNSSRVGKRDITLTLEFVEDSSRGMTVESLRHLLYEIFSVKSSVVFEVKTESRHLATLAYVKANEPNIFSERSSAKIKLVSPSPYFYSVSNEIKSEYDFSLLSGGFTFEFANESLYNNLLKFSDLGLGNRQIIEHKSDISTGVIITMEAFGSITDPRIVHHTGIGDMTFNTEKLSSILVDTNKTSMSAGEVLTIDTRRGNRRVTYKYGGVEYNATHLLSMNTEWLTLDSGSNEISYTASSGAQNLRVKLSYVPIYGGV